ncbi:glycosyltransferase [Neobacillus niacini]|uniref:glycosyltransferase n=1 Tax=Neobacillus niacini TaxID=86668 RepID=UPI002855D336|nr:glycosyltransferase [Neobacillus niacini]MDR6998994.1 GT2 family glycosyltransferase [Neobacillus niacini]
MEGNITDRLIGNIKNSFTYEFMVKPENIHQIDKQSREIPVNSNGKNYIIGPARGVDQNGSGICVSIGMNGVSVYEYTNNNIYATLVYETSIHEWVHVAVVYKEKRPFLFINGTFVKEGEKSSKKYVSPSGSVCYPPGVFFIGDIKEIRIWDHSRTANQLKVNMNARLKAQRNGLYAIWPEKTTGKINRQPLLANNKQMNQSFNDEKNMEKYRDLTNNQNQKIEVSIIIPSYNKYPLNLFTLYSLENQTFNLEKMEVIIIDDGSTDQTEETLQNYHPPYQFKYIRNNENLGRAKVRNIGIQASSGSILIFLDAEMLVDPNFVTNHVKYHQAKSNLIMSGVMYSQNIISCIFPKYDREKLAQIAEIVKDNQNLNSKFSKYEKTASKPYPLINKSDITNQTYGDLIKNANSWFRKITSKYGAGLEGFEFPWMALLTGNVSLRKELLSKAGIFDEDFVKYGYEDWELGYRLYKAGAKYLNAKDLVSYHQEHPVEESKWKEAIGNYHLFIKKHHEVDVLILSLELSRMMDLTTMNDILQEYKNLVEKYGKKTKDFQNRFISILDTMALLLKVDIRHFNILGAAGFGIEQINELKSDLRRLNKLGKYKNLANFIEKVIAS